MNETEKSRFRRSKNGDFDMFFKGNGIDIGCGPFDTVRPSFDCQRWDLEQGDACIMAGVPNESFDWVYSSHCLEHLSEPTEALEHWWRILKPGGYLIVIVPDFALYEKFIWPSRFNKDHKWAFSIYHNEPTNFRINIAGMLGRLKRAQILRIQLNENGFDYNNGSVDQQNAQREIEFIVRKQIDTFWCG